MKIRSLSFPHLIPDLRAWPIYRLSADRERYIREIVEDTFRQIQDKHNDPEEMMAKCLFLELQRIKVQPWKVDPPNDKQFWNRIKKQLGVLSELDPDKRQAQAEELMVRIIRRYAQEIVGHFKIGTFRFARIFLTAFFKVLFDRFFTGRLAFWGGKRTLSRRLHAVGSVERVRNLWKKGVVNLVPTHSSNLDSIFVGYVIDLQVGLPSFSYGAGLNLFNSELSAYFMNRLGAYRVDRRKKNHIYLETLKSASRLSIFKKVNNLFFPGGTRSRSGSIEQHLKLGLMGTAIEAQRLLIEKEDPAKIFMVPVIITYPHILEGHSLIEQHLRRAGRTRYIAQRGIAPFFRWIWFGLWDFFSKRSDAYLSFGDPLDVFGNDLDADGNSVDAHGKLIDIREYFLNEDREINRDTQRESIYTKRLADRITENYLSNNIVLKGHVVAFCLFRLIYERLKNEMDFYEMFNIPAEDTVLPLVDLEIRISDFKILLLEMEKMGKLKTVIEKEDEVSKIINQGMREISNYHWKHPAKLYKKDKVISYNLKLLYFYHNRLDSYPDLKLNIAL